MKDDRANPGGSGGQGAESPRPPSLEEVLTQDDLHAAWRFFAAAREQAGGPPTTVSPIDSAATTLDFSRYRARRMRQRLLNLLDDLLAAVEQRDMTGVWRVLDESDACRCFPSVVREEALVVAKLPRSATRPPMRLYRYYHQLMELGDEPMENDADTGCAPDVVPDSGPGPEPAREIAFPDRRPPGGGPARRSSGSR